MDFQHDFQPHQIVCLEHEGTCLYAEVIQVVVSRQLCWVRPLLLGTLPSDCSVNESLPLTDMRSCADLLWPIALFRPAFDTEVIPLLVMLASSQIERNPAAAKQLDVPPELPPADASSKLNQFVYQVWQADLRQL